MKLVETGNRAQYNWQLAVNDLVLHLSDTTYTSLFWTHFYPGVETSCSYQPTWHQNPETTNQKYQGFVFRNKKI
jgi:hypothetical protein